MFNRISNFAGPISVFYKTPLIGRGSAAFTAASNMYLSLGASSDWAVGTGDFTIEWWQYQTTNGNENYIMSLGAAANLACSIASGGGRINVYLNGTKVANPTINGSVQNVWTGFSVSRVGGTLYVFQGGTLLNAGGTADSTDVTDNTSALYIGVNDPAGSTNDNWPGDLTNIRFIKGTGLYNANYTIATSPLSAVTNTKLLLRFQSSGKLLQEDSGTSKTVTNNNAVAFNSATPF